MVVNAGSSPQMDKKDTTSPPNMFIFGGGYIGFRLGSNKKVSQGSTLTLTLTLTCSFAQYVKMSGFADGYYSSDGAQWTKINYEEGGVGASTMPYYSSQEWVHPSPLSPLLSLHLYVPHSLSQQAQTIVDKKTKWIGLWGQSLITYNVSSGKATPGNLFLIAGSYTGLGTFSSRVFVNSGGIYCDVQGVVCNGK